MKFEDLYHTGLVVDDIEAAMRFFTDIAGYEWCGIGSGEQIIEIDGEKRSITMTVTYSKSEPRIELIQSVPGTLWTPTTCGVHHLGYWSEDVDRDIQALLARGLSLEAKSVLLDGTAMWAYCRNKAGGPRIELVGEIIKPMLMEMFKAGVPTAG